VVIISLLLQLVLTTTQMEFWRGERTIVPALSLVLDWGTSAWGWYTFFDLPTGVGAGVGAGAVASIVLGFFAAYAVEASWSYIPLSMRWNAYVDDVLRDDE
jgi:hypothetical protein